MSASRHPALDRLRAEHGSEVFELLGTGLSGADLVTVLLEAAERRAAVLSPVDVLGQYERDRFVRPSTIDGRRMAIVEHQAMSAIADEFDVLTLAPLTPLGTHSVIAGVHQNRVITTMRGSEVAADPTNGLALEAALRRRAHVRLSPRSADSVSLAGVQRVTRAQQFEGPLSFAHFSLLGMAVAGRDTGNRTFERHALVQLLTAVVAVVRGAGADGAVVVITDFDGRRGSVEALGEVADQLGKQGIDVRRDETRTAGRGYYPSWCFKLHAVFGDEELEVGDGGFVPWTQLLLSNAKERLLIGGIGLDRLAIGASRDWK